MEQRLKARAFQFDAPVNSAAFCLDSSAFAFGLGDGHVHIVRGDDRRMQAVHKGAVPALRAYDDGFISLSDDGTLNSVSLTGAVNAIADFKGAWTERLIVHDNGNFAVAVGKSVHLWTGRNAMPRILGPHDSTINDIHFTHDGLGLAAAHRDGVTLWARFDKMGTHYEPPQPVQLKWKGAHLAVTLSRDKRWVVTAMQEGALHLWNVGTRRDFQMSGYWGKPTRMAWSTDKRWLATSGAETVVLWPFDKAGPEGREPQQLGWSNGAMVSALASHPEHNVMAAGFEDGAVVMLDLEQKKAFSASAPSGHAVTVLAFSPDGHALVAGTANGGAAHFDFLT